MWTVRELLREMNKVNMTQQCSISIVELDNLQKHLIIHVLIRKQPLLRKTRNENSFMHEKQIMRKRKKTNLRLH